MKVAKAPIRTNSPTISSGKRSRTGSHRLGVRREKHKLPFTLLSDEDAAVSKAFGVYKQKNLYGKKYMGIERSTFIIDRTGRIAQIYPKVKVEGHVQEIVEFLRED